MEPAIKQQDVNHKEYFLNCDCNTINPKNMIKQPDFKETTSLQQYRGSIDFLQAHIQLLDASLMQVYKTLKEQPDQNLDINKALNLKASDYDKLNHPCKQRNVLVNHSRKKNIEFAILRLFNLFTTYLQSITKEMFAKNPMLVVGKAVVNRSGEDKENLTMSYAEIIRLGSYENLQEQIVLNVFRSIEELKSTSKLLEKILKDTKVNIPKAITENALTYLEMRHLLIHNRGLADNKYAKTYGKKIIPNIKEREELPMKFETFTHALVAITTLVAKIDEQLIKNGIVEKRAFKIKGTLGK